MKEKMILIGFIVACITALTWHFMSLQAKLSSPTIAIKCDGGLFSWQYDINLIGSFATPEEAKRHGDNVSALIRLEEERKKERK